MNERCIRCNGCLYRNQESDVSCINCGWMRNEPYPNIRDAYDPIKCRNCANRPMLGKRLCEPCLEYQRAYNRQAKLQKMGLL